MTEQVPPELRDIIGYDPEDPAAAARRAVEEAFAKHTPAIVAAIEKALASTGKEVPVDRPEGAAEVERLIDEAFRKCDRRMCVDWQGWQCDRHLFAQGFRAALAAPHNPA